MPGFHSLSVAVLVCWLQVIVHAINLDITVPLVKTTPGDASRDRFGYSVVLHHITRPIPGDFESFLNSARIIVGAPHGTFPGGVSGLVGGAEEQNTGLVYQCPVGPEECGGVTGNGQSYDRRLFDGYSNGDLENKTGQLMGAVLYSNGDLFMACAPLYVVFIAPLPGAVKINLDDSRPVGRCYISGRNLEDFEVLMPCSGITELNNPARTTNSDGHCLAGFSAAIITSNDNNQSCVTIGAPGKGQDTGQLYYYSDTPGQNISLVGRTSTPVITNFFGSDGLAATTGYITSDRELDVISGAPRNNGSIVFGSVNIRSQADKNGSMPILRVNGNQTGEQFGTAIETADLNNDGFDELIVGAPIYTTSILEAGRVYVYENLQGTLSDSPIILEGHSVQSRFGSSIVNLGDINGDGFHDIVIGAPYEDNNANTNTSGTIYIYNGRGSDGLISTSPDLILRAENVTSQVPGLTSLKGFGFSLASGDIDGNLYQDLLVGAHLSGNAVLIRSFSLADVVVNISTDVKQVQVDPVSSRTSTFSVTVCANYSGLGLGNRSISTVLVVRENSSFPRIEFTQDGKKVDEFNSTFIFPTTSQQHCIDVDVSIKPLGQLSRLRDLLSPINIVAEFSRPQRPAPDYSNGSPVPVQDLRDIPLLSVGGTTSVQVTPFVACAGTTMNREVCMPDLIVSLKGLAFLDSSGEVYNDTYAVAGQFHSLLVELNYSNIGVDPALGAQILFTLPEGYTDVSTNQNINCAQDPTTPRLYRCFLSSYIPPQGQSVEGVPSQGQVNLTWLYTGPTIIGNEPSQSSDVSIELDSIFDGDRESNETNNQLIGGPVVIQYTAVADFEISSFLFRLSVINYRQVTQPLPERPTIIQLGRTITLSFRGINRGPSNSPSALVDIFIPTNDTRSRFFLYPASASARQGGRNVSRCDFSGINPQGLEQGSAGSRKKRSAVFKRQEEKTVTNRQASREQVKNCSDPATRASGICTHLSCTLDNFVSSQALEIQIETVLDDRYYVNETDPFIFIAYATLRGNVSYVHDNMPSNNQRATPEYRLTLLTTTVDGRLPIWIPILIAIVILIIFILLFILLCLFGLYRHRKKQKERENEGEYPLGPKVSLDGEQKENILPGEEDIKNADMAEDIGDASDLQDNTDIPKPQKTDETSI